MMIPEKVHPTWESLLTEKVLSELREIERKLGKNYNPSPHLILRFLHVDLSKVKVIWLGQDVYPAKGVATGRSFEVGGITSWSQPFRQVSVKNIIRLIYKNYVGINNYSGIKGFNDIKEEIKSGHFPIKEPKAWFDSLERQGVLFLNTSFTCEVGKANSHKQIWQNFSEHVLNYISSINPDITWFLWGKEATKAKQFIVSGKFFESRHPMMCSAKYTNDFLKSSCFASTWNEINWLGE